jgi:hypothetical protein
MTTPPKTLLPSVVRMGPRCYGGYVNTLGQTGQCGTAMRLRSLVSNVKVGVVTGRSGRVLIAEDKRACINMPATPTTVVPTNRPEYSGGPKATVSLSSKETGANYAVLSGRRYSPARRFRQALLRLGGPMQELVIPGSNPGERCHARCIEDKRRPERPNRASGLRLMSVVNAPRSSPTSPPNR